jgi:hypothetical protein
MLTCQSQAAIALQPVTVVQRLQQEVYHAITTQYGIFQAALVNHVASWPLRLRQTIIQLNTYRAMQYALPTKMHGEERVL